MRLGAPVEGYSNAEEWAALHARLGYGAAYFPLSRDADSKSVEAYALAAERHDLVIAEVGAWCNPLDPDPAKREANVRYIIGQLRLADAVGARCCVNISGSRSSRWDGPHPDNLTKETFDEIVATTRRILDAAKPTRAFYALEPMPWAYPCDAESTLALIEAVDRPHFGVHVDMCNMVNSPEKAYTTGALTRAYFAALRPHIRSVHAKDTLIREALTVHIDEAIPGEGLFDYATLLEECARLGDVPVMCEHLRNQEEYGRAVSYIRSVAAARNLTFQAAK